MLHQGEVAMRPVRIITAVIFAAAVAIAGCTVHSTTDPSPAPTPQLADTDWRVPPRPVSHHRTQTDKATLTATAGPRQLHFATPQAAMRYLTAAYNRNDLAALKHVTTPEARNNLLFMRPNADNLRLVGCTANPGRGDYLCEFTHGFPTATHHAGTGQAHFTAAPADKVGWYMTVLNDCG
jgi:hypothetical protein